MEQEVLNRELKNMLIQIGVGDVVCGAAMAFVYVAMYVLTRFTGVY